VNGPDPASAGAASRPLRFHWRLPLGGEEPSPGFAPPAGTPASAWPDFEANLSFCRLAERYGIDSLLTAFGYYMPDPIPLVAALGQATERVRFMLAYRPGLLSPTVFVQQVNTLASLSGGRLCLNVVMGHSEPEQRSYGDFLSHDQRYQRADDFLAICRAFWRGGGKDVAFESAHYRIVDGRLATPFPAVGRTGPEIYLGGGSAPARQVAARHADCWLRLGEPPEALRADVEEMRAHGVEVGLRLSLVVRPTREEALQAAAALLEGGDTDWVRQVFVQGSDSASMQAAFARADDDAAQWPRPWLWTGAVKSRGASAVCLVGSPGEVAQAILEYRSAGITQFILSGWPNSAALRAFGEEVLPRVRAGEAEAARGAPAAVTGAP
jgi:alkanesulfonate monooxygenase